MPKNHYLCCSCADIHRWHKLFVFAMKHYTAIVLAILLSAPIWAQHPSTTAHVNPLIGTDAQGDNHPGATVPFGLIKLGADTRQHGAGYHYADDKILGFSHLHQSGSNCAQRTDVVLMPYSGTKPLLNASEYAAPLKHANEQARAGYYAVALPNHKVKAEFTATTRVAMHRYTFDKPKQAALTIDLGQRGKPESAWIKLVSNNEIHGHIRSTAYGKPQMLYFVAQTSVAFEPMAVADGGTPIALTEQRAEGRALAIALRFPTLESKPLLIKVALSLVDERSAQNAINIELPGWDFDKTAAAATAQWDKALGRIEIKGGTTAQRTMFYTSLYRVLSSLSSIGSCDGIFVGADNYKHRANVKIAGAEPLPFTPLGGFALWSTHRALHPLLGIVAPERTADVVNSLVLQGKFAKQLPSWNLYAVETDSMVGYHAASVIADAWAKGFRNFDTTEAMKQLNAATNQHARGIFDMLIYGFVPNDLEPLAVSKSMEYAQCNWCVAQMADALKDFDRYDHLISRSQAFQHLFNREQKTIAPRLRGGQWADMGTNSVLPGHAPLCDFAAPHDVLGMIEAHGGDSAFVAHLKALKDKQLYNHSTPAAHHIPYLYTFAGQAWRTQRWIHALLDSLYSPTPQGLCGSDMGGQLSAWYVMSAMGLYPVCPGSPHYTITTPLFERITIHLDGGKRFVINAEGLSGERCYIARTSLNQRAFDYPQLSHAELMAGGELRIDLLSRPNPQWATSQTERVPGIVAEQRVGILPTMQPEGHTFSGELEVRFVSPQPKASIFYQVLSPTDDPNSTSGWEQGKSVVLKQSAIVRVYSLHGRSASAIVEQQFDKIE